MSRAPLSLWVALALGAGCRDKGETGEPVDDTAVVDSRVPATADVVVVGSGPAGLAAALAALEAGAEVLLLERSEEPGLGAIYAGQYFAAGTDDQANMGITDSVELAIAEWEGITGVSGDHAAATRFLEESAVTLDWLGSYGVEVETVSQDVDSGSVARMHKLDGDIVRAMLMVELFEQVRVEIEVEDLLVEDGAVVGVRWRDLRTDQTGETRAGAVVAATGGFLRDRARVDAVRSELAGRDVIFETSPLSNGGGLAFLEAVGATSPNAASFGVYMHGLQDPGFPEGEAMVLTALDDQLLVTLEGARFADEGGSREFSFFERAAGAEVVMVTTAERAGSIKGFRPAYNWASLAVVETFTLAELRDMGAEVYSAESAEALAEAAGLDPDGLGATIEAVNALIAEGGTDEWGRDFASTEPFETDIWWGARLRPGLAKGFGGVSADADSRVLDAAGQPVPGLYAAGEVVGMIPDGGAGAGFAGSVGACYSFGRLAGIAAAAEVIAR